MKFKNDKETDRFLYCGRDSFDTMIDDESEGFKSKYGNYNIEDYEEEEESNF